MNSAAAAVRYPEESKGCVRTFNKPGLVHSGLAISIADFEFDRISILGHSSLGTPYFRNVVAGMPKIPQKLPEGVVYLYASHEAAKEGKDFGGTGFCVGVPLEGMKNYTATYIVTNWHVAIRDGMCVVRRNSALGPEFFNFDSSDWEFEPRGDDIAAIPISATGASYIPIDMFVDDNKIAHHEIGAGEDVFMIGRFVDHDGGPINKPAFRFGNISVMPSPIEQPTGGHGECFCIDMHSRSGYSGSPVFVYRTAGQDLDYVKMGGLVSKIGSTFLLLLGIHWGQFADFMEIEINSNSRDERAEIAVPSNQSRVKGLSGMTCVVPAWKIISLLNRPSFIEQRARLAADIANQQQRSGRAPEAE